MMYTIYKVATGEIVSRYYTSDETAKPPLERGESFVEGFFEPKTHRILNGQPVAVRDKRELE